MKKFETLKYKKRNAAKVFKLNNVLVGGKKKSQDPIAIKDPKSGEVLTDPKTIKETIATFLKELLTNCPPSHGYEIDLELKRKLHEVRMKERIEDGNSTLTLEMFNKNCGKIKERSTNNSS